VVGAALIEPLTDDDLRDLLSQWRSEPPVFEVIEECLALRARVAKLEGALLDDGVKLLARNARLEAALRPFAEIFSPPMSLASEVAEARAALKGSHAPHD
jgi:hypothetical protein